MNGKIDEMDDNAAMAADIPPHSLDAIAERLIALRELSGLNQRLFAQAVGSSPTAWNNYERAIQRISIDAARLLCQRTGVNLHWIYDGEIQYLPPGKAEELGRQIEKVRARKGGGNPSPAVIRSNRGR